MKAKKVILNILIVIFAGIAVFSGYKLFNTYKDAQDSSDKFSQLEQIVTDNKYITENETMEMTASERYSSVYDMNNHFVGWVSIDGTTLNYPVVQTKDNPEYYLRRNFDGQYSDYGVPFMDYKSTPGKTDNVVIYGHNMKNGTMFSAIEKYADPGFWSNNKIIKFDTMESFGEYEVICAFRANADNLTLAYHETVNFKNAEEFNAFFAQAKTMGTYDTGVTPVFGDEILTLSTCEYTYENGRFVVMARKIAEYETKTFNSDGNEVNVTAQ